VRLIATALVVFLFGCKSGTYDPGTAAEDAKVLIALVSDEIAFELEQDGKTEQAAEIRKDAALVAQALDAMLAGEITSIDALRTALNEIEARVIGSIGDGDDADLKIHRIQQVHTVVAFFISRWERAQAAEVVAEQ